MTVYLAHPEQGRMLHKKREDQEKSFKLLLLI